MELCALINALLWMWRIIQCIKYWLLFVYTFFVHFIFMCRNNLLFHFSFIFSIGFGTRVWHATKQQRAYDAVVASVLLEKFRFCLAAESSFVCKLLEGKEKCSIVFGWRWFCNSFRHCKSKGLSGFAVRWLKYSNWCAHNYNEWKHKFMFAQRKLRSAVCVWQCHIRPQMDAILKMASVWPLTTTTTANAKRMSMLCSWGGNKFH